MMRLMLFALALPAMAVAGTVRFMDRDVFVRDPNYDAGKIAPYALEDPLAFVDGRRVTKETWAERRREILGIFAREMYGEEPPKPETVVTELLDEKVGAGGGGCPLAKRDYGENISTENRYFAHWYCRAYAKYAEAPEKTMPFDQHLFLACVAPRGLLIAGYDAPWFDTEGEYLAAKAASPAWELLTGAGLPKVAWPADYDTSAIGPRLGYVRRSEKHGISACDWTWLLDFADRYFGK